MNDCSPACGWCGRCEDDIRESPPREYLFCEECGQDAMHPISLQGVGVFCSRDCATKASHKHATAMDIVRR